MNQKPEQNMALLSNNNYDITMRVLKEVIPNFLNR